jgi:hypothetical protein
LPESSGICCPKRLLILANWFLRLLVLAQAFSEQRLNLFFVFGVVVLVVLTILGVSILGDKNKK